MEFVIVLTSGDDGFVVAECPALPGCISQGRTREEALENVREAIELCIESQAEEGWNLPAFVDVARIEIEVSPGGQ